MISLNNYSNADACVIKFLQKSFHPINPDLVIEELDKHPDYPSLLAISDVLNNFDIKNYAFRMGDEDIADIPCPFIAHSTANGGEVMLVTSVKKDRVIVSSEKWDNHAIKTSEFNKIFDKVVLVGETSTEGTSMAERIKYQIKSAQNFVVPLGLLSIFFIALFKTGYFANLNAGLLFLTIIKSVGVITSVLLLIQSINSNNPLIQRLCGGAGNKDCNAILSSKAAKVFDWLSWSEVGFFYFTGTWLLSLFAGDSLSVLRMLFLLNVVSLPYTFYSLYYQSRVAKQWCVLCCTVQGLLWLELLPLAYLNAQFSIHTQFQLSSITAIIICLSVPILFWILLKPLLLKIQKLKPLTDQLRTYKYNATLFNKLLNDQPKYAQPDENWSIVLGNKEANNIITMVTNPFCPPCAHTHKVLAELLERRTDLQARIVFTANNSDKDPKTPVARHMMFLNDLPDKNTVKQALHDWYEQKQKNYETWAKVYPAKLNEDEFYKLDKQKAWCKVAEVTFTPTFLLNGSRLPELFQLSDLKYMLD